MGKSVLNEAAMDQMRPKVTCRAYEEGAECRMPTSNTANSPIRVQCAQTEHGYALIRKVELYSFPTIYDNQYLALYRHIIYRWKALELNLKNIKTGDALILEVRPYWGIYDIWQCHVSNWNFQCLVSGLISIWHSTLPNIWGRHPTFWPPFMSPIYPNSMIVQIDRNLKTLMLWISW